MTLILHGDMHDTTNHHRKIKLLVIVLIFRQICRIMIFLYIKEELLKSLPKNYRPIALTPHLIKIFEKVVRNQLVTYIEKHNLFNITQHGFRFGRPCLSQLLEHYDKITKLMEDGHDVDIIYVDFAKAFDKVDINIAMAKIKSIGISGCLADWIYCFHNKLL